MLPHCLLRWHSPLLPRTSWLMSALKSCTPQQSSVLHKSDHRSPHGCSSSCVLVSVCFCKATVHPALLYAPRLMSRDGSQAFRPMPSTGNSSGEGKISPSCSAGLQLPHRPRHQTPSGPTSWPFIYSLWGVEKQYSCDLLIA